MNRLFAKRKMTTGFKMNRMKTCVLLLLSQLTFTVQSEISTVQPILNLLVKTDGIYRIDNADIISHGISLIGVELDNISLLYNGIAVPVKIVSNDELVFDSNSYIEFIGISGKSLYQQGNVYTLVLAENIKINTNTLEPVENQIVSPFYLHTDLYANNNGYSFGAPNDDPWFDKRLLAIGSEATETLLFDIDNLIPQTDMQIEMNVWGGTDYLQSPDHHVIYELNGETLDDFRFDGITSSIKQYQADSNSINNGEQQIIVRVPNDTNTPADVIHIESWKVTYPRDFVMINKQLDFAIGGNSHNANSDIIFKQGFEQNIQQGINHYAVKNANNENYIVYRYNQDGSTDTIKTLSSSECNSTVSNDCLVQFSLEFTSGHIYIAAESELKTPEISVPILLSDINQGDADYLIITHPDFIGEKLDIFVQLKQIEHIVKVVDLQQIYAQYGYSNISADSIAEYIKFAALNLGVTDVLLIGGDSYDYHNYLGLQSLSFIPTIYGQTDDLITFAPIDAKYVDIDNDNIPDINIGRFPVRTETELANLTTKIQKYSAKNYSKTAVFAADKFDLSNGYSFQNDAQELINLLPQQWQNNITIDHKAFVDEDGIELAKSKIINGINQGVALTSFIGHSGPRDWSFSRIFSASDANLLSNINEPTLVTQWGCWNTYFVSPTEDTLAHAFMLNQNGGAASVLGASTLTKAKHESELAKLVLSFLTHDEMSLGDAVTQAKRTYAQTNPSALDVILGWTILGDPSLKL